MRCNYQNTSCYQAKAVAKIDSIDKTTGNTNGGQTITIKGHGFNFKIEQFDIKVDGVNCKVIASEVSQVKCITGAQLNPSNNTNYVGQHGLRRKYINTTYPLQNNNITNSTDYEETLAMDLEAPSSIRDANSGNIYTGYFKAPADAAYRFYMTCDDWCQLYLGNGTDTKDPSSKVLIYQSKGWSPFRDFFQISGSRRTEWFNLTKDQYYYIEARHIQYSGDDHMSVALEIQDQNVTAGHQHTMREIQRLTIDQDLVRDTANITFTNPDGGQFYLSIVDPKTFTSYKTEVLNTNMSAWDLNQAIQPFYYKMHDALIRVYRTMYMADGNETTNPILSVQTVFSIQVQRSHSIASTNSMTIQRVSTKSDISIRMPKDIQVSNAPLTGMFKIKCALDNLGTRWNYTLPMNQTSIYQTLVKDNIVKACPIYRDKIEVSFGPKYNYAEDGRDIIIRFFGLNYDIPQFEILSDIDINLQGNNVVFNNTAWMPYDPTVLFYEPLPFEFLYTQETQPQVVVNVAGIEAVCVSLNCSYNYIALASLITGLQFSGTTLTITGTNFRSDIQSIKFSHIECTNFQVNQTQIICTVTPVAGNWAPVVIDSMGTVPVDPSCVNITVGLTISSVTPNTDLNPVGGTILSIVGTGLPHTLTEGNTYNLTFSDGSSCNVISLSPTRLMCLTTRFDTSASTTMTLKIDVNGVTDSSLSVDVDTVQTKVISVTPASVSPVLKRILTIVVKDYPYNLDRNDIDVILQSQKDPSLLRPINIVEIGLNGTDQYLKVKFGGSDSGLYNVLVKSRSYGNFDSTGVVLKTDGKVTDFNPKQGSVHGGTLITVDGYHFSDDYQDNPIRIGYTDCLVEVSTPTQLICRTEARIQNEVGQDDFIVLLKTYEEAVCEVVGGCVFEWVDTANLTSYEVNFDDTLNDYVLKLIGTGFNATLDNTEILIDNIKQQLVNASDTEINVRIIDMLSYISLNTDIHLPTGHPASLDDLNYAVGIQLTSRIHGIKPSIGSLGGALIIADVRGIGNMTKNVTLVTQTGTDICQTVTIVKYGQVQCLTKENLAITDGPISLKVGTYIANCTQTGACNYQTSSSLLTVLSLTSDLAASTITIAGTGFASFPTSTPMFKYAGVNADIVTLNSDLQAVATFNKGIPLTSGTLGVRGYLWFQDDSTLIQQWATSSATLLNSPSATAVDQSINCSFSGGCTLSITQSGLLANLQLADPSKNSIRVCGQVCKLNVNDSTASQVQCYVPSLPTTYSIENFNLIKEQYLLGTPFSSDSTQTMLVWDGSHQNGWTKSDLNCYFGTAFRAGYVGELNEVKYFMSRFQRSKFIGKLKFQGSQTGASTSWTDIFIVGEEIHEGWNYHNYEPGSYLKYRYYRFFGTDYGSCIVGEVSLRGYEVIDSSASSHVCTPQLYLNGGSTPYNLTGTVTYQGTQTPLLKSISPRFGSVVGNETVTFEGIGFSSTLSDYTVIIDNRVCTVTFANETHFKCLTSKRPGLFPEPTLDIRIAGKGAVSTQGLIFRYVNYWSEPLTWGGEFAPIEGDMIYIPKGLNLLVDVDSTPILSAVVVEGALIFPPNDNPNHLRTFDAHYVMVRAGYFEAGTEQFPYTSKLIITMHSNRSSPELPIFGNKVIAMYNGVLDIHGVPRVPTWTSLDNTANINDTQITLMRDVDWQVGEEIVIAPTGYYNDEVDQRIIIAVDRTNPKKPVLTLDSPLTYKHYAAVEKYGVNGQDEIEMRAEVGLLTRNIMYRGDPETSAAREYGAHIMVHSNGMETLTARIEYVHFFDCGQAFQLGRYPIHFHLIGAVHNSYIKGNAIHQSYNRACTIHGVHYLRILDNVVFNVKGHNFFIEDAAETKNYLENNLAIWTKRSWSLLVSDQTPASFWITHPDNIFRGNHAAGSDRYGFWFDTKPHPTGPSFDPNICPENTALGEFTNNVAHSNGRYGLRVFHNLVPRTYPCLDFEPDPNNTTDPYWKNPPVVSVFRNFTGYKNLRNGAIGFLVGWVRFENFKVADNILAGIEVERSDAIIDGYAVVDGAIVIGRSQNFENLTDESPSHGIITPRTDNYGVHNVRFYNFNMSDKAALGSCSHCFSMPSTDSGARTVTFSKLYFDPDSVTIKIRYQEPRRDIFYDLDGSLTGLGPKTWTTPYFRHNDHKECTHKPDVYDGLICDSSIEVRRIVYYNYLPDIFTKQPMRILQYDDSIVGGMDNVTKQGYLEDIENYTDLPWRKKLKPTLSYAFPVLTGKKYKIHWKHGLDFMSMQVDLGARWVPTDKDVYIIHNFTDVRAKIDFLTGGDNIQNQTILASNPAPKQFGVNIVYNDTATREIHYLINGKNASRTSLVMNAYRCVGPCIAGIVDVVIEDTARLWSNPNTWKSGKVPLEGEDAIVQSGYNIIYDIENDSPIYRYVEINGRVTFPDDGKKRNLRTNYLFVRTGELIIGNQTNPYQSDAMITLYGNHQDEYIAFSNDVEAGNKFIANTALISMWGAPRKHRTRLLKTVNINDTEILVEAGLGWKAQDRIALPSTTMIWNQLDYAIITAYDNETGVATLDRQLTSYHWGAPQSTGPQYNGVDMRGEVMMLTRNIKIRGNDTDAWGCQILTSDFEEDNKEMRVGRTFMDHVEIFNCSQYDTWKAALRFERAKLGWSRISNSSIYMGLGIGANIQYSNAIELVDNNFYTFTRYGLVIQTSDNITFDGNWVSGIYYRQMNDNKGKETQGVIIACGHEPGDICDNLKILNNIASSMAGSQLDSTGFSVPAHECGDHKTIVFRDNIAHSIYGYGGIIYRSFKKPSQLECIEASRFTAYKCSLMGIVANQGGNNLILTNMTLIDNQYSLSGHIGVDSGEKLTVTVRDIKYYGETEARDCISENICETDIDAKGCYDKYAFMPSMFSNNAKAPLIDSGCIYPQFRLFKDASHFGSTLYENNQFYNFKTNKTWCGKKQRILSLNPLNTDHTPASRFVRARFENVTQDALAFLFTPPNAWTSIDICGQFPCTGPLNTIFRFERTTFAGTIQPSWTDSDFQVISANDENSGKFTSCKKVFTWNGYYCTNDNLAMIVWESMDSDRFTRIVSPIEVIGLNTSSRSVVNSFMDHIWDGFYPSLLRLSRFVSVIQAGKDMWYEIVYKGTPPQKQRFTLNSWDAPVSIRIKYPKAGVYIIKSSAGKEIPANGWDTTKMQPKLIRGSR